MGSTEGVSTGFDISNIFSTGQIIIFSVVTFLIIVIIVILKLRGKSIQLKKINFGPFEAEIDEKKSTITPVYSIAVLRHPSTVSGNPATLNSLKVRVYDRDGNPLKNKRVTITIDGKEGTTERYLSGQLSQISDDDGYVIFSGLAVLKRGTFCLVFHADNVIAKARPFDVTPPGLDTNFASKEFGSEEYIDTLKLAISLSKGADKVTINDEEII